MGFYTLVLSIHLPLQSLNHNPPFPIPSSPFSLSLSSSSILLSSSSFPPPLHSPLHKLFLSLFSPSLYSLPLHSLLTPSTPLILKFSFSTTHIPSFSSQKIPQIIFLSLNSSENHMGHFLIFSSSLFSIFILIPNHRRANSQTLIK